MKDFTADMTASEKEKARTIFSYEIAKLIFDCSIKHISFLLYSAMAVACTYSIKEKAENNNIWMPV